MLCLVALRRTASSQLRRAAPSFVMTPASGQRKGSRLSSSFRVVQHNIKGDHTREYIAATKNGDQDTPRLSVNQYIPLNNPNPQPGDVSIIAAHANGFPKELYEPLWETLINRMEEEDIRIRSIWIADVWNQGESGIINENILGNDPNWFDHSRDLLSLINQKQDEIPHPLVGIGHSMGGTQLAYLSLLHPRLLRSLVLIDPVIQSTNPGILPAIPSTSRRDLWPSREAAIASFKRSKFYQAWDPRALDLWIEHGLRDTPTELHPSPETASPSDPVTLATSKHQELFSYLRPMYRTVPGQSYADKGPLTTQGQDAEYPFYRPEPLQVFQRLPELRPSVLYVFAKDSYFATPELREAKMAATGTGLGGSGGVAAGRVQEAVLDCGHMIPMEKVTECGKTIVEFLSGELKRWKQERSAFEEFQKGRSRHEQMAVDERWKAEVVPAGHDAPKPRI